MNKVAIVAGAVRATSGISFLVAPERAQLLWSQRPATDPTARLLLRSMGYRDALIGGALLVEGARAGPKVSRWFLARPVRTPRICLADWRFAMNSRTAITSWE